MSASAVYSLSQPRTQGFDWLTIVVFSLCGLIATAAMSWAAPLQVIAYTN